MNDGVPSAAPGEFGRLEVGPLEVWPPVVLAPMAGVTDSPFRQLCREFATEGARAEATDTPGLFVNQMITARALVEGHRKTLKLAEFGPDETPRSIQLYGTDPIYLAKAVEQLVAEGKSFRDFDEGR